MVEKRIVNQVDEKLAGRAVHGLGAGHGQRAAEVFQAVIRFIFNWRTIVLLAHVGGHAAALDHEVGNDPMKNSAVVEAILYVGEKVRRGEGSFLFVQSNNDIALSGF